MHLYWVCIVYTEPSTQSHRLRTQDVTKTPFTAVRGNNHTAVLILADPFAAVEFGGMLSANKISHAAAAGSSAHIHMHMCAHIRVCFVCVRVPSTRAATCPTHHYRSHTSSLQLVSRREKYGMQQSGTSNPLPHRC